MRVDGTLGNSAKFAAFGGVGVGVDGTLDISAKFAAVGGDRVPGGVRVITSDK